MLQKFLPDIIQEIIELDEEKYHRGKGKKLIKRNSHTNTNVKGKKKTKKNKVHAHDEALESMHSMDGLDLDDFVMDGGNDGNGTNEKFEVSRLATDTHTMAEEWHEEIDLSDAHQNTMEKAMRGKH